jgi:hypothetical protein
MARYLSDIQNHDGIFGVACGAWQNSREYIALASGKPEDRLEAKFIFDGGDSFAIYQTEQDISLGAYKSYEELEKHGLDINRRKYNLVYTAPLPAPPSDSPAGLFMWVNAERLEDYNGRALAISDVLSIKKDELITSHYANGRTFKELLSFMGEEGRKYGRRLEIEAAENAVIPVMDNVTQEAVQEKQINDSVIPVQETPQLQAQAEMPVTPPIITETAQSAETPIIQSSAPITENPPPALPEIKTEVPVYRLSAKQAEEHGVTELYDLCRRMDIDCAKAISEAIQANKKSDNRFDLATPAEKLTKLYGNDRMKWVLAKHIRAKPTGFTNDNFLWAKAYIEDGTRNGDEPPAFAINTHYAVLEAFVNEIRVVLNKKPTFSERMKTAKKKSDAHNKEPGEQGRRV